MKRWIAIGIGVISGIAIGIGLKTDWQSSSPLPANVTPPPVPPPIPTLAPAAISSLRASTRCLVALRTPPSPNQEQANNQTHGSDSIPFACQGSLKLFILAGQSNMSGRGELPKSSSEYSLPMNHPQVFVFGNDYRWSLASEPVDTPQGQVDLVSKDDEAAYSPAVSFATSLLAKDSKQVIGLIPCARGATTITDWQRNLSETSLYGSCLKRVRAASLMGSMAGLLFFQGESDALSPQANPELILVPDRWHQYFSTFVQDFRTDLGQPQLPVVFAQLGKQPDPARFSNWNQVKQQQKLVKLPYTTMITTDDLPADAKDPVHFISDSYRRIGERFADSYWQLTQPK